MVLIDVGDGVFTGRESHIQLKKMANFNYWGDFGNIGTDANDTFRIGGGGKPSAYYHNGWIDGGGGHDTLMISGSKNDWELTKGGKIYFLSTEVQGIYSAEKVTIELQNMEKVQFTNGSFDLKNKQSGGGGESNFNEIIGSKKGDILRGKSSNDFVWGGNGDDDLYGNAGDDMIVGGKGADYIYGGGGKDDFGVSKIFGKGKKNFDRILDFEVGKDRIYVEGSTKGLWMDNYKGDAYLMLGKNDVIAMIDNAGGDLDWSNDGGFIM